MQTFFQDFCPNKTATKQKLQHFWDSQFWIGFKCKTAASPGSSPFPRLSPGLRTLPSFPPVKLGYKGAEGVVGGNIN